MKRTAFTMVELVFVIVILGILAAVAIPKLNITRNDAETTAAIASFKSAITQIQSDATAKGIVNSDLTTLVDGNANLLVEASKVTARTKAENGVSCATATVSGTDLLIEILSTSGGCNIFSTISNSTVPLLGITVAR